MYTCLTKFRCANDFLKSPELHVHTDLKIIGLNFCRESYLISEPQAYSQQDPVEEQHGHVHGCSPERRAGDEDGSTDQHGCAAAKPPRDRGREQRRDEAGDIEGGGEHGEELTVELAVVADVAVLLVAVHLREERLQK